MNRRSRQKEAAEPAFEPTKGTPVLRAGCLSSNAISFCKWKSTFSLDEKRDPALPRLRVRSSLGYQKARVLTSSLHPPDSSFCPIRGLPLMGCKGLSQRQQLPRQAGTGRLFRTAASHDSALGPSSDTRSARLLLGPENTDPTGTDTSPWERIGLEPGASKDPTKMNRRPHNSRPTAQRALLTGGRELPPPRGPHAAPEESPQALSRRSRSQPGALPSSSTNMTGRVMSLFQTPFTLLSVQSG